MRRSVPSRVMRSEEYCTMDLESSLVARSSWTTRASSTRPSARVTWAAMASRIARRSTGSGRSWARSTRSRRLRRSDEFELRPHRRARASPQRCSPPARRDHTPIALGRRARSHSTVRTDELGPAWPRRSSRHRIGRSVTTQPMTPAAPMSYDRVDGGVPHVRALGGRDEALGEASQRLLAASVDRLGSRQAGQAEHDQHEHHHRGAGEDATRRPGRPPTSRQTRASGATNADDAQEGKGDRLQMPGSPGLFHRQLAHRPGAAPPRPSTRRRAPSPSRSDRPPSTIRVAGSSRRRSRRPARPARRRPRGARTCFGSRRRTPSGRARTSIKMSPSGYAIDVNLANSVMSAACTYGWIK